jgi:hypothetical protein
MAWQRVALGLHVACVLLAYSLVGLAYLFPQRTTAPNPLHYGAVLAMGVFAAVGFMAGLAVMASRSGNSERLVLAFSTIAAFLLALLAW